MTKHKRKGGQIILDTPLFDTWEYHNHEEERLQDRINKLEEGNKSLLEQNDLVKKENDQQRLVIENQQSEINQLREMVSFYKLQEKITKFPILNMVDYCKSRPTIEEAKPIKDYMYYELRFKGTREDYALVDSIDEEFRRREKAKNGNNYHVEHMVQIPNVGNYNAEVHTQNNNYPLINEENHNLMLFQDGETRE